MKTKVKVEFIFSGFEWDIDTISKKLGLEPDEFKVKGTKIRDLPKQLFWEKNMWILRSEYTFDHSLPDLVEEMMNRVRPFRENFIEVSKDAEATLSCIVKSYGGDRPRIWFEKETVKELAEYKAEIVIDLYIFGDDTDEMPFANMLRFYKEGKYGDALKEIEIMEMDCKTLTPELCMWKSILIQLNDEDDQYEYEDIQKYLKMAIELDPEYTDAYYELGHYNCALENDSPKAIEYFDVCIEQYRKKYRDAILSKAKCYHDLDESVRAEDLIKNSANIFNDGEIEELLKEVKE